MSIKLNFMERLTDKNIKVKLIVSIDEWDKYADFWAITKDEAKETQDNGNWYIETTEEIAEALIDNEIAKQLN